MKGLRPVCRGPRVRWNQPGDRMRGLPRYDRRRLRPEGDAKHRLRHPSSSRGNDEHPPERPAMGCPDMTRAAELDGAPPLGEGDLALIGARILDGSGGPPR